MDNLSGAFAYFSHGVSETGRLGGKQEKYVANFLFLPCLPSLNRGAGDIYRKRRGTNLPTEALQTFHPNYTPCFLSVLFLRRMLLLLAVTSQQEEI